MNPGWTRRDHYPPLGQRGLGSLGGAHADRCRRHRGVALYLTSPAHELHDPNHALQQLDLLYLDQPAPGLKHLPVEPARPSVLVFCENAGCPLPQLEKAQVVRVTDPRLAARYALTADGQVGPGYALIDDDGQVRYRTFDPGLAQHQPEIRTLVNGLP